MCQLFAISLQLVGTKLTFDGMIQAQKYNQQNGFLPYPIFWMLHNLPQSNSSCVIYYKIILKKKKKMMMTPTLKLLIFKYVLESIILN